MMYRVKVTNFNLRNEATYTLVRDSSHNADLIYSSHSHFADLIPIINSQTHTMLQLAPAEANDLAKY